MSRRLAIAAAAVLALLGLGAAPAIGADLWHALAACESENGRTSANQFQFTPDTWAKVGTAPTPEQASYAEQREAAIAWATMVDPASTAGWPTCWPIALRAVGLTSPGEPEESTHEDPPVVLNVPRETDEHTHRDRPPTGTLPPTSTTTSAPRAPTPAPPYVPARPATPTQQASIALTG